MYNMGQDGKLIEKEMEGIGGAASQKAKSEGVLLWEP